MRVPYDGASGAGAGQARTHRKEGPLRASSRASSSAGDCRAQKRRDKAATAKRRGRRQGEASRSRAVRENGKRRARRRSTSVAAMNRRRTTAGMPAMSSACGDATMKSIGPTVCSSWCMKNRRSASASSGDASAMKSRESLEKKLTCFQCEAALARRRCRQRPAAYSAATMTRPITISAGGLHGITNSVCAPSAV